MTAVMERINIPGPFKFFHTYNVPPIEVNLPLVVSAHVGILVLKAVASAVAGGICFLLAGAMLWAIAINSGLHLLSAILVFLAAATLSVACSAFAYRCVRLASHLERQLEITADSVLDRRQDACVAWSNVRHMSIESDNHGTSTIVLYLHLPVKYKLMLFNLYIQITDTIIKDRIDIDIRTLNERSYILVHTVAELVRHHGGTTCELTRWGWD